MSDKMVKEDPIKLHKTACALMEEGKCEEAIDIFGKVADLYYKGQNYFGAAEMHYKAGECALSLKNYQRGVEFFTKSSEISFNKGFERYGLTALQSARECHKALGNAKEVEELTAKINQINQKLIEAESGEQSFSVFG